MNTKRIIDTREAASLSGEDIDHTVRFIPEGREDPTVVIGELRQVYHVGGHVTINVIPAFNGSSELVEYSMSHKSRVEVLYFKDASELTLVEVLDTAGLG